MFFLRPRVPRQKNHKCLSHIGCLFGLPPSGVRPKHHLCLGHVLVFGVPLNKRLANKLLRDAPWVYSGWIQNFKRFKDRQSVILGGLDGPGGPRETHPRHFNAFQASSPPTAGADFFKDGWRVYARTRSHFCAQALSSAPLAPLAWHICHGCSTYEDA